MARGRTRRSGGEPERRLATGGRPVKYLKFKDKFAAKGMAHAIALRKGVDPKQKLYDEAFKPREDAAIEMPDTVESGAGAWGAGQNVAIGDVRTYQGRAYLCIQSHRTQSDW